MDRHEWLAERRLGIGGSDIAAIMGVNKWATPLTIYFQKVEGREVQENNAMRMGRVLEPVIAQLFAEETGAAVYAPSREIFVHEKEPIFRASVDRVFENHEHDGILECKTTRMDLIEPDPSWFCQLQWYLLCTNLTQGAIAVLSSGFEYQHWYFIRDDPYISKMQEEALRFWRDHVIAQVPPEPRTEADVRRLFPSHLAGKQTELNDAEYETVLKLSIAKDKRKDAEITEDALAEIVKCKFGDAEALIYGGKIIATFKKDKDGVSFDAKNFEKEHPDLYRQYARPHLGARKLLVKV